MSSTPPPPPIEDKVGPPHPPPPAIASAPVNDNLSVPPSSPPPFHSDSHSDSEGSDDDSDLSPPSPPPLASPPVQRGRKVTLINNEHLPNIEGLEVVPSPQHEGAKKRPTLGASRGPKANPADPPFTTFCHSVNSEYINNSPNYITTSPLKIYCGTYNVNGKVEADEHRLLSWLETGLLHEAGEPDVFAIGLQEMIDLSASNVVMDGMTVGEASAVGEKQRKDWVEKISSALEVCACAHDHHYKYIASGNLVGIMMVVFVKDSVESRVSDVQCEKIKTGNMGLGNKGGVLIRMNFDDTSICFVSAHFAANRNKVVHRNKDFDVISTKHVFTDHPMAKFAKLVKKKTKFMAAKEHSFKHHQHGTAQHKDNHADSMQTVHQQLLKTKTGSGRESKVASMLQAHGPAAGKWWTDADTAVFGPAHGSRVSVLGREGSNIGQASQKALDGMEGIAEEEDDKENEMYIPMYEDSDDEMRDSVDMDIFGHHEPTLKIEKKRAAKEHVDETEELGKLSAMDHDVVLFMGDLNYRMRENIDMQEIFRLLSDPETAETNEGLEAGDKLFQYDQLNIERKGGRVFREFSEGRTAFLPTYKYIPGEEPAPDVQQWYDVRPDKKKRCPAWCDRVLYRINPRAFQEKIKLLQYRRIDDMYISDHKPVNALFSLDVKKIDHGQKVETAEKIVRAAELTLRKTHGKISVKGAFTFNCSYKFADSDPKAKKKTRRTHRMSSVEAVKGKSSRSRAKSSKGQALEVVDQNSVIIQNLNQHLEAKYKLVGVPSWMIIQDVDLEGTIPPGLSKTIFARVIDEQFEDDVESPMNVIQVCVEGGLNKMIGTVDWRRFFELERRRKESAVDTSHGDKGKLHKMLGLG
ncbi:hypothetical protein TL16_g02279 [Triparma laevis f. inornata]|uniref:Inositol polyphosphate-related phosphatase domain-containing protein n=1 Tax=Triparma laevis f. inornata TaxID=1714386 RepID=A0A9W6ZUL7_9STRA|nr:hypothetical protein TL16_g02279 [Triparma laevis f. inornata]